MDLSNIDGYAEAQKAIERHTSARARWMSTLERYVDGTQYTGLADWFADGPEAPPLWERAPCFVYPMARSAIESNSDLLFGESRFPVITSRPCEDDASVTEDGLTIEESETLDRFIREAQRQTRFRFVCRQVFAQAQASKSACAIFGARNGRLFIDTVKARWCEPMFDADGNVTKLVIQYPYLDEYIDAIRKKPRVRACMYRREIDANSDVTMLPAELKVSVGSTEIDWRADPKQSVWHTMGFCPVRWYAHMKGCSVVNHYDGHAIHEHLLDELRALDFAISQRHRAALYSGDPQWTEIGVSEGEGPRATGRAAVVPSTMAGGKPGASNQITGHYIDARGGKKARRKSPGSTWQYESPDVKVHLHTLPGDALNALTEHAKDMRSKLCEAMSVVFFDHDDFGRSNDVSGRALEARKARQIERCDLYREDFGHNFIVPAISMLVRVSHALGAGLRINGIKEALPILSKFVAEDVA